MPRIMAMSFHFFSSARGGFLAVLCQLLIFSSACSQTSVQKDEADKIISGFQKSDRPGIAVAIIAKGEVIYTKATGMANLEHDIPISTATRFHTASVSKQFTAFATLLLVEEGKLSLDDDIRDYLPEVPDFGHTITLRHLITHTSGLRDQWNLFLLQGVRPDDVITKEHVLTLVSQQKELNFKPGEEYLYCNTGFTLLAEIVARVSGKTFAEFTQETIFEPLGMARTLFRDDHEKIIKNSAASYVTDRSGGFKKLALNYANVGATNLTSTAEDLSLWVMNFKEEKVGNKAIFEQMQALATTNDGNTFGGGMGLFMGEYKGMREVEHGGADAGFRAQVSMFPEQDFSVIVLSNSAFSNPKGIAYQLTDVFLEPENNTADTENTEERKFVSLDRNTLKNYEGNYVNRNRGFTRHIYLKGDSLIHFRTENNESALAPLSKNSFKVMNVPPDVIVSFEKVDGEWTMTETVNGDTPRPLEKFNPQPYSQQDWQALEGTYWSPELNTSYQIIRKEGLLTAVHQRMGSIELEKVKRDFFLGNKGFFGQVDFIRDSQDEITGLRVSNGRVRNLWFEKR